MDYFVVCSVALLVSGLTFIAGFGLGTLLMPAFALFFPLPLAIAATAVVHLVNNIFKAGLIGRKADLDVVLKFGIPGFLLAMVGAVVLNLLEDMKPIFVYTWNEFVYEVTAIKLTIGILIIIFALIDIIPSLSKLHISRRYIYLGGALSGFFGGLSGHQGALRTTFLIKFGLEKEVFIATGIVAAVLVDVGRILVYGSSLTAQFENLMEGNILNLMTAASLCAFLGAFIGRKILKKITFRSIQLIIGSLLIIMGFSLIFGFV